MDIGARLNHCTIIAKLGSPKPGTEAR